MAKVVDAYPLRKEDIRVVVKCHSCKRWLTFQRQTLRDGFHVLD